MSIEVPTAVSMRINIDTLRAIVAEHFRNKFNVEPLCVDIIDGVGYVDLPCKVMTIAKEPKKGKK